MKELLKFIDSQNIAADLDEDTLKQIGEKVCADYAADRDSMADWVADVEKGLKVAKIEHSPKSWPWEGASNYKSQMIFRAAWQFGDRATVELLTNKNLVKASIEGQDLPENVAKKNRITKHMNWQFNYEMPEWRDQQESLFYEVATIGVAFKKTFFDPTEGRNVSRVIHYPNFAVNNETTCAGEIPRFTECKDYTDNEIQEFVRSGVWVDFDKNEDGREEDIDEATDENEDHIKDEFIEQHTVYDLDDDGYAEPYIITVHKPSGCVCRIVALYDQSSIYVKAAEGVVSKLEPAMQSVMQSLAAEKAQQLQIEAMENPDEPIDPQQFLEDFRDEALGQLEIVKIKKTNLITRYGFIPDPEGKYLSWGFCAVLCNYAQLVNTTTNQLIDSGTLANVPGGFLSQEFRTQKSPMKIKPGEFQKTNVPAKQLAEGLQYYNFRGPDPQLANLNETVKAEAAESIAIVNLQDTIAPNAPATTTLGLLQEKLIPTTAILRRMLRSMTHEFRIMAELNHKYTDPQVYQNVVDEAADYRADYEQASYDIELTAAAAMTNQAQKMQVASVLSAEVPNIQAAGGDTRPILQNIFEGVGADELFTKVFPDPNSMTAEQQAALQQQQAIQEQQLQQQQIANQIQQATLQEQQIKNELERTKLQIKQYEVESKAQAEMAEMQRKAAELQIDLSNQQIDAAKAQAEIDNMLAQAEKYRAEAGSTVMTAQLDAFTRQIELVQQNLARFNNGA